MNRLGIAAIAAGAVARCFGITAMIMVGIVGLSLFCADHYVVFMRIHESNLSLEQLGKTIASMRLAKR